LTAVTLPRETLALNADAQRPRSTADGKYAFEVIDLLCVCV
jgi:hypothetical protein